MGGVDQSVQGYRPERLVPAGQGAQLRILDLLGPPQLRQAAALAREQLLGQSGNGMDVEQRTVGVEGNSFDAGHGSRRHVDGSSLLACEKEIKLPLSQII